MYTTNWPRSILDGLKEQGLERILKVYQKKAGRIMYQGREYINFSSNDYLNLSESTKLIESGVTALKREGTASSASRLVTGTLALHDELERELAEFKSYSSCLVYSSGALANLGIIRTVLDKNDFAIADKLVHATLLDGVKLSGARLSRFLHNDCMHLEKLLKGIREKSSNAKILIITDSVFSMDGDCAPLVEITELAKEYQAMLLVDEAHAMGVFGDSGAGLVSQLGLAGSVDFCSGTFSKAFASYGGFVCCSEEIKRLMINRARSFVYNTSLPPAVIDIARAALELLVKEKDLGAELLSRAKMFREKLSLAGLNTLDSNTQIIPILVGQIDRTLEFIEELASEGLLVVPIRPPTVPPGTSRVRLSVTLAHSLKELDFAADVIIEKAKKINII